MVKLFANSGDPDQMPHSAVTDLGLHCLPVTLLWVSRLQWVRGMNLPQKIFLKEQPLRAMHTYKRVKIHAAKSVNIFRPH